jgi:uncharacterized repeat protein (TIGR01451 family)
MPTFRRTLAATFAAIVAALLIALAPAATAKPKPPQPPPRPERMIDPATESDPVYKKMLEYREWYRTTFKISPGSNVAVFHFKYPNGKEGYWAIHSDPTANTEQRPTGHSEWRGKRILQSLGIDLDTVDKTLSELETCNLRGRKCKMMMARDFKNTEIGHLRAYPDDPDVRKESMKGHKAENRQIARQGEQAKQIMNPGGRQSGGGALPRMLGSGRLGGIDFSSLELRYVSDKPGADGRDLGYAFRAPTSATPGDPGTGLATARESSDAFFTWLALPPQSFWVNLNPSEPDRIIDPQLARTDVGRVLLDADMALKRTSVNLTRPDTPLGDQYWDELERLYGDRLLEACWSARVWIVPSPASVRETNDELYILDAPLDVKMVSQEIVDPAVGRPGCPAEPPAVEAAKAELFQRLILPHLVEAVNTAPEYAALRRVYLARVAAEWFRQRSGEHPTAVSQIANSGDVTPWLARTPWNPMDIFNQMLTSTRNGEWTVERDVPSGGQMYKRTLIYGGVDFSQTPRQNVSKADFKSRYPRLAKQTRRAEVEPTPDSDANQTWIGGGNDRPPITSADGAALKEAAVGLRIRGPQHVQAGRLVRYRLRVFNATPAAMRDVQVCDRLSSELVFVRASRQRRVRDGRSCWQVPRISGEGSTDIRVTARVLDGARGSMRDTASVSMPGRADIARVRQQRTFRVQTGGGGAQPAPEPRPGGVTG